MKKAFTKASNEKKQKGFFFLRDTTSEKSNKSTISSTALNT